MSKYLVTQFSTCDEVLSSYCQRNADALVVKDDAITTFYIELSRILDIGRFKNFCKIVLPAFKNKKPEIKFYKAKVEFSLPQYAALLFGAPLEKLSIKTQLQLEVQSKTESFAPSRETKKKGVIIYEQ